MLTTEKVLRMNVSNFAEPNVACVKENDILISIKDALVNSLYKYVIVLNGENKLIGYITEKIIMDAVFEKDRTTTAREIMIKINFKETDLVARETDSLDSAIAKLRGENNQKMELMALPLIGENGSVKGQITRESISKGIDKLIELRESV